MLLHWIHKDGSCSYKAGSNCERKGKYPLYSGKYKNFTTDIEQIKKWWTETPHANIGVQYFVSNGENKYGEEQYVTDRNGNMTEYERDVLGNITRVYTPDRSYREFVYDQVQ